MATATTTSTSRPAFRQSVRDIVHEAIPLLENRFSNPLEGLLYCYECVVFLTIGLAVALVFDIVRLVLMIPIGQLIWSCGCKSAAQRVGGVCSGLALTIPRYATMLLMPRSLWRVRKMRLLGKRAELLVPDRAMDVFLIPIQKLQTIASFPKHEDGLHLLEKVPISSIRSYGGGQSNVVFVSHKWVGNSSDPENKVLGWLKSSPLMVKATHVFFDFSCVPQDDEELRLRYLQSIPDILDKATIVAVNGSGEVFFAYSFSVWCQLEAMLSMESMVPGNEQDDKWTIFDHSDLYDVLPGFLAVVGKQRYNYKFMSVQGSKPRAILSSILRMFVTFHDGKGGEVVVQVPAPQP